MNEKPSLDQMLGNCPGFDAMRKMEKAAGELCVLREAYKRAVFACTHNLEVPNRLGYIPGACELRGPAQEVRCRLCGARFSVQMLQLWKE